MFTFFYFRKLVLPYNGLEQFIIISVRQDNLISSNWKMMFEKSN